MKHATLLPWFMAAVAAALLAACASTPPPPDWQMNAHSSVERATAAYLEGNTRVADAEWARARTAVRRTGRADLLARVELTRCAAQLASLEAPVPWACPAFDALRQDASPAEQAYARYLAGAASATDVALLPPAQQSVVRAGDAGSAYLARLREVPDPLARLVAAAAVLQRLPAPQDTASQNATPLLQLATLAVDTASAQGWQRPLLAWLALQERWALQAGHEALAAEARRRSALIRGD